MKKNRYEKIFLILFILICVFGMLYSFINIVRWIIDNNRIKKEISDIQNNVEVTEVKDDPNTEITVPEKEDPFNPYWDYIKMKLIDVDFKELKKINSNTAGWIQVGGTNINYPFAQANDNEFYLTHSFNKNYNKSGWAFLDYRNNKDFSDRNTIVYGHALKSGAIFGTLKNVITNSWLSDANNHIIKLSTEKENSLWQIFSVYTVPVTSDYLKTDFANDDEFIEFSKMLIDRSIYNFNTNVGENDRILTLSSCYKTTNNKIVVHAKLIKKASSN